MKRRPYTSTLIVMSIATLILSVGCVSNPWDDFGATIEIAEAPSGEVPLADAISPVADGFVPSEASEEPVEEELTPHEKWEMLKDNWDKTQAALMVIDPTYEPKEFPYPDPDLVVEEMEIVEEPVIEEVVEEPHPAKEPNVSIDSPIEAFTKEDRARSVNVADTEVPDWFVWICASLIVATLIAMCYIAKQRKEAHWYRRRERE